MEQGAERQGRRTILTLGWSAVLLALSGVVSSAVLQQVRPPTTLSPAIKPGQRS